MSYVKPAFTADELAQRAFARRTIENLMGRRFAKRLIVEKVSELEEMWCKKAADPCLAVNDGYYKGYESLATYFEAKEKQVAERAEYAKSIYAIDESTENLRGVGSLSPLTLTTPIVEIAGDGQTAKGLWYIVGAMTEVGKNGAEAAWYRGKLAADFVLEDGQWKIWHLVEVCDLRCRAGANWVDAPLAAAEYAPVDTQLPAPDVMQEIQVTDVPVPYGTFEDTFSYGF